MEIVKMQRYVIEQESGFEFDDEFNTLEEAKEKLQSLRQKFPNKILRIVVENIQVNRTPLEI